MNSNNLAHEEEPIAALASAQGAAAIAVLRLSGTGCITLSEKILKPKGKKEWLKSELRLCSFCDPSTGSLIDEPMAVYFKGPHSYTGQDSVEIFLHGGPIIVQKALRIFYQNGFRPAEPGEFTRRAYLSGKMDLTEAEGIRELVEASSEQQWFAARQLASGSLRDSIENLRLKVMETMAFLEARIDFPDEKETSAVEMREVDEKISLVKNSIERLRLTYNSGKVASQGMRVALFGEPNAGKSTLMNELLGSDRAIVTDIAGTTRDYLEESCLIDGRLIRLIDTAGIQESDSVVEQIGIERSIAIAKEADIVLFLAPANNTQASKEKVQTWITSVNPSSHLIVHTKSDLKENKSFEQNANHILEISCKNNIGIDKLKKILAKKVDERIAPIKKGVFITSERHKDALDKASLTLEKFVTAREEGLYDEMLAFELRELSSCLASIIGKVDSDEILGVVFSAFCVGK